MRDLRSTIAIQRRHTAMELRGNFDLSNFRGEIDVDGGDLEVCQQRSDLGILVLGLGRAESAWNVNRTVLKPIRDLEVLVLGSDS